MTDPNKDLGPLNTTIDAGNTAGAAASKITGIPYTPTPTQLSPEDAKLQSLGLSADQIKQVNEGTMDPNAFKALTDTVNTKLKTNNELTTQRSYLISHLYDHPLTPDEMSKIPPEMASVIAAGPEAVQLQIRVLNDQISGRASTLNSSIQSLSTAYDANQKNTQAELNNLLTFATNSGYQIGDLVKAMEPVFGKSVTDSLAKNLQALGVSPYVKSSLTANPTISSGGMSLSDAITSQESAGQPSNVVNPDSGALGKYQIMPMHLSELGLDPNNPDDVQKFLNDPSLQLQLHNKILSDLNNQYGGNQDKVIAAYYGGAGAAAIVGTPEGDKPQGKYPSINEYVDSVKQKMQGATTTFSAARPDEKTGNQAIPGLEGKSANALYQSALRYAFQGGNIQQFLGGLSSNSAKEKVKAYIDGTAAAIAQGLGVDEYQLQALYKANSSAVKQNVERLARVESVNKALTLNTPRLKTLADAVKAEGVNITESDIQAGYADVLRRTGSTNAAAYSELIQTIRSDYSAAQAALAGSRGGQFFSDAANKAIPVGLSSDQYQAISDTIILSTNNAQQAIGDTVQSLIGTSGGSTTSSNSDKDPLGLGI